MSGAWCGGWSECRGGFKIRASERGPWCASRRVVVIPLIRGKAPCRTKKGTSGNWGRPMIRTLLAALAGFLFRVLGSSIARIEDCPRTGYPPLGWPMINTLLAPLAGFLFMIFAQASLGSIMNKKPLRLRRKGFDPVGVRGFEPPTSSSRTTHANRAALHPEWWNEAAK